VSWSVSTGKRPVSKAFPRWPRWRPWPAPAPAGDTPATEPLRITLDDAIDLARLNNLSLAGARLDAAAAVDPPALGLGAGDALHIGGRRLVGEHVLVYVRLGVRPRAKQKQMEAHADLRQQFAPARAARGEVKAAVERDEQCGSVLRRAAKCIRAYCGLFPVVRVTFEQRGRPVELLAKHYLGQGMGQGECGDSQQQ